MPRLWRCSRPGWLGPWTTWPSSWSSSWQTCLWQGSCSLMIWRSLLTQVILWFYGSYQIDAVLCKPYAVISKQLLPGGTNSRFSHSCHNSDEGPWSRERADFQGCSLVLSKDRITGPELLQAFLYLGGRSRGRKRWERWRRLAESEISWGCLLYLPEEIRTQFSAFLKDDRSRWVLLWLWETGD